MWSVPPKWMHADCKNLILWCLLIQQSNLRTGNIVAIVRILRLFLWYQAYILIWIKHGIKHISPTTEHHKANLTSKRSSIKTHNIQPSIFKNSKPKCLNACSCDLCMTYLIHLTTSQHLCINKCLYSNAFSWYSNKQNPSQDIITKRNQKHVKTPKQNWKQGQQDKTETKHVEETKENKEKPNLDSRARVCVRIHRVCMCILVVCVCTPWVCVRISKACARTHS